MFTFIGVTKDPIRSDIEKFGFYQTVIFAFISVPIMLSAMFILSYIFTAGEIKYRYEYMYFG